MFWISYKDFLKYYPDLDRTRLFGPEWSVSQQWTSLNVPWTVDYLDTKFALTVPEAGPVVIVLSKVGQCALLLPSFLRLRLLIRFASTQPDERYFRGFSGRYNFDLHFRLYRDGEEPYLLRSMEASGSGRSCIAETHLEPGAYTVLVKVSTWRNDEAPTAEEVIRDYRQSRREKVLVAGQNFDLSHAKGRLREAEIANAKEEREEARMNAKKKSVREREERREKRRRERENKRRKKAAKKAKDEEKKKLKEEEKKAKAAEEGPGQAEEEVKTGEKASASSTDTGADIPTPQSNTAEATDESIKTEEPPKTEEQPKAEETPKATEPPKASDDTTVAAAAAPATATAVAANDDAASVASSVATADFSFRSSIDGPAPTDAEAELEAEERADDVFAADPWRAVCVVGLRVCARGRAVGVEVVRGEGDR